MSAVTPLPHDMSELGMPAAWYWFEVALDCVIRWERAKDLHQNARDPIAAAVADDACLLLDIEARRSWTNFRSRA